MAKVVIENEARIRIKIAGYELEVQGPKLWAEKMIANFVRRAKKQLKRK